MVPLKKHPAIFLFTGAGGKSANYSDRFMPDGTFRYTGEGRTGDMKMNAGNQALRDHVRDGRDVLLFEKVGTTSYVRFLGQFFTDGFDIETQLGADSAPRKALVFKLVPIEALQIDEEAQEQVGSTASGEDLLALRARAFAAIAPAGSSSTAPTRTIYARSADVRNYVLARAAGVCEACGHDAPFSNKAGAPFLEAHHVDRLSDGGLDRPDRVAGVCPNCHRRAHYAADGAAFNAQLRLQIAAKEDVLALEHQPIASAM